MICGTEPWSQDKVVEVEEMANVRTLYLLSHRYCCWDPGWGQVLPCSYKRTCSRETEDGIGAEIITEEKVNEQLQDKKLTEVVNETSPDGVTLPSDLPPLSLRLTGLLPNQRWLLRRWILKSNFRIKLTWVFNNARVNVYNVVFTLNL